MSDFICNVDFWGDLNNHIRDESGIDLEEVLNRKKKYRKDALLYAAKHKCEEPVLYSIIEYDEMIDCVQTVHLFAHATIPMEQLENAVIYNMQGVRVEKSQVKKGLYIVNGRKTVIK